MNPYVSNPDNIPATDSYVDVPLYGRYFPRPDDFRVHLQHVNSQSTDSLQYWASVVNLCNESIRISPADEGGRDVFALGSVIVKLSPLHKKKDGQHTEIDYSYADANEVQAVTIAKTVLKDVRVPEIYFAGEINDCQVLIQERLPGVGLNVAWPYLSQGQKESFKQQARQVLRQLHTIKPPDGLRARCHVVKDPNILTNGLDNDKIVGLVDWEMAGFFGWKTAGEIHRRIRTPQREHFANANLSEETLQDIIWWNDLYADNMSHLQE